LGVEKKGGVDVSRVVMVTGGGGRNMGAAICRKFAEAGDRVVVADADGASAEIVAEEICAAGGSAVAMALDVNDVSACSAAIQRVIEEQGQLDVLCLHAGGGGTGWGIALDETALQERITTYTGNMGGSLRMTSDEELTDGVQLDIFGNSALAREALEHMVPRGSGVIMVTISEAGLRALAHYPYVLAKHAMIGLVKHVAYVFGPAGIRCNGICPGHVGGDLSVKPEEMADAMAAAAVERGSDPYFAQAAAKVTRLSPRRGSPEEVANIYQFVASEAASFLNGAIIPVDAGWSAA
jgi:NAD(P)-dependent dehydrogenase (short-subunit alcohol dehydrogenase family)